MVKGTTNGTITDLDGRFTLSIGKGTELIVSYVGYTTKTVKIGNQSTIKIVLIEDTKTLDEVVVIGYIIQYDDFLFYNRYLILKITDLKSG